MAFQVILVAVVFLLVLRSRRLAVRERLFLQMHQLRERRYLGVSAMQRRVCGRRGWAGHDDVDGGV